jgi:hypothetical protein
MSHRVPFPHLLKKLCALVDHRLNGKAGELTKLKHILRDCAEHERKRNQLVHSYWYPNKEGVANRLEVEVSRSAVTYQENREEVSGEALDFLAERFGATRDALHEFMARNFDTYRAWCAAE